jgi:hypothetical protein
VGRHPRLANDTFIAPGHLAQATVAEYCAAGAYEGLAHVRPGSGASRRDGRGARPTLGKRVTYVTPMGGYFLWDPPARRRRDRLAVEAEQAGVPVVAARLLPMGGGGTSSGWRSRR